MPWIAALGAVAGGLISGAAAQDAARTQTRASRAAIDASQRQFEQTRADLAPWRAAGAQSLSRMSDLLGLRGPEPVAPRPESFLAGPATWTMGQGYAPARTVDRAAYGRAMQQYDRDMAAYENWQPPDPSQMILRDPSYQFRRDQGNEALLADASARGLRLSPATQKALLRFNSDLASQEFGASFNRLAGMSQAGQNAAAMTGQFGQNAQALQGSYGLQGANAAAAGTVGLGNAINSAIGPVVNQWQQQRMLDQYLNNYAAPMYSPGYAPPAAMGWTDAQGYGVG